MKERLNQIFKGKVVIVGVGNSLKGDDGFGPALIERLEDFNGAVCLDAGTAPESYTGKIKKECPDTIIIADAAHLNKRPGAYDILKVSEIIKSGFTTHDLSPKMFIEYLQSETKADIYMLGVQPQNLSLGDEMSRSVKEAIDQIEQLFKEIVYA